MRCDDKTITPNLLQSLVVFPRAEPKELKGLARLKTPWDFMNSVFAKYRPDNAKILNECFFFDWDHCRAEKIIKDG